MSIPPSIVDPNQILMTGENPFVRLALEDSDEYTTSVSFWRMTFCPAGPGHVLFAKSELTDDKWRIYSDNSAMTRWLRGARDLSIERVGEHEDGDVLTHPGGLSGSSDRRPRNDDALPSAPPSASAASDSDASGT